MKEILTERGVMLWFKRYCSDNGCRYLKLNPAEYCGLPDRMVLTPRGSVVFVELKSRGKNLRPMQEVWRKWLLDKNHKYLRVDRVDDVNAALIDKFFKWSDTLTPDAETAARLFELSIQIQAPSLLNNV